MDEARNPWNFFYYGSSSYKVETDPEQYPHCWIRVPARVGWTTQTVRCTAYDNFSYDSVAPVVAVWHQRVYVDLMYP